MNANLLGVFFLAILMVGCGPRKIVTDDQISVIVNSYSDGGSFEQLERRLFELEFEKTLTFSKSQFWQANTSKLPGFDRSKIQEDSVYTSFFWEEKSLTGYGMKQSIDVHSSGGKIIEIVR